MKKNIVKIAAALFFAALVAGVAIAAPAKKNASSGTVKIVTDIFPVYDWVREITKNSAAKIDLTLLLDNGVDLHSYQPAVADVAKIAECDLFVYVGGESEGWMDDACKEIKNKNSVVLKLLDSLGDAAKEEEVVEGMEADHDHESADEHDHEHEHKSAGEHHHEHGEDEEGPEYDEHIWLSVKNAKILCNTIAEKIAAVDPKNAKTYRANAAAYNAKLSSLDAQYQKIVDAASKKTVLFGDRFPFRYLVDDYGLSYYAAFVGCSAETEASFKTILFLAKKVDELGIPAVLTIEKSDGKIAKTIIKNTKAKNQKILTLDSMQSTTSNDVKKGVTYLSIMTKNADVLKSALQ